MLLNCPLLATPIDDRARAVVTFISVRDGSQALSHHRAVTPSQGSLRVLVVCGAGAARDDDCVGRVGVAIGFLLWQTLILCPVRLRPWR